MLLQKRIQPRRRSTLPTYSILDGQTCVQIDFGLEIVTVAVHVSGLILFSFILYVSCLGLPLTSAPFNLTQVIGQTTQGAPTSVDVSREGMGGRRY